MTLYGTDEIYQYFVDTISEIVASKTPKNKNNNQVSEMMERFNEMILKDLQL